MLKLKGNPRWSNCVFCGEPVRKADRSKEHVLPMWLLRVTGDPNRRIKIESNPISGEDVVRPASTFHFPACRKCNESYGHNLEAQAKNAVEALLAGGCLQVSQCYGLLDWLDKVRIGLWLAYNTLHQEAFEPKFQINQRLGTKDRIAIISVDPHSDAKGLGIGGTDNHTFRTTQAGLYLRINNVRIISMSYDSLISCFSGMPYIKEIFASAEDINKTFAQVACDGYDLSQDWRGFAVPGATVIAQTVFWPGGSTANDRWQMYFNSKTAGRLKQAPRISKPEDLDRCFQTQLISNAEGCFRYYANPKERLRFGLAKSNDDVSFMKTLYLLYWQHVVELTPKRVVDQSGERYGVIVLGMLWLEKALQIVFRLRAIGVGVDAEISALVDELQKVTRLREESTAHLQGTCVPEYSRLSG